MTLHLIGALPSRELLNETGEPHEIHAPEKRPALPDEDFWIRGGYVGPLRRHRANCAVVNTQQEPLAFPVIAFANADELPPDEWMKGMGHADKLRRSDGNVCFLRRVTSVWKGAALSGPRSPTAS